MKGANSLQLDDLDALVFDFDGVLTDNGVLLDQDGKEWVRCHRGDGLAFDALRKLGTKVFILSTEKNPVVSARAKKLKVPVVQGISNKVDALKELATREGIELAKTLYTGNDLNDLWAMKLCGFSACPADSHPQIKEVATIQLVTNGGAGVVRELLEVSLNVDIVKILFNHNNGGCT